MLILIDFLVQILYTTADKISLKYLGNVSYRDRRFTAGQIWQKGLEFCDASANYLNLFPDETNFINLLQSM